MASQSNIETSALVISELIDKARTEMTMDLYKIGKEIDNLDEFIQVLLTMDIEGTLKSKLTKATSIYADAHRAVLEGTVPFAEVSGNRLISFAQLNEQVFDNSILRTISGNIRNEVAKGIQAGMTTAQIVENVASASISTAQMNTLVNTTLNTYSRTITNEMMNEASSNTEFVYEGATDDRVRDECWDMISAGRLTQQQIISQFGAGVLTDGGGFNCRHKWEIASEVGREKIKGRQILAKEKINA